MRVTTECGEYLVEELPAAQFKITKTAWWGPTHDEAIATDPWVTITPVGASVIVSALTIKIGLPWGFSNAAQRTDQSGVTNRIILIEP